MLLGRKWAFLIFRTPFMLHTWLSMWSILENVQNERIFFNLCVLYETINLCNNTGEYSIGLTVLNNVY